MSHPPRAEFLSVVIPAYNEETRLERTLLLVIDYLRKHHEQFEVIVVDDGSIDGTPEVVDALIQKAPEVRRLSLKTNRGKGYAVRMGMLDARGDCVLFSDADLSTPIEEVEKVLALLAQGFDVVIASRARPGSDIQVRQSFPRETMGKVFNLFVRVLSGLPFPDTQCGFKCFRRVSATEIFRRATVDGFAFDVEALVLARRLGYRVTDVPVCWVNSPDSRVGMLVHPLQMLRDLIRIRFRELRGG